MFQVRKVSSKEGLHIVTLQGRGEHGAGPDDGELDKMVEYYIKTTSVDISVI